MKNDTYQGKDEWEGFCHDRRIVFHIPAFLIFSDPC